MGPIGWTETLVNDYQSTLRNILEEQRYLKGDNNAFISMLLCSATSPDDSWQDRNMWSLKLNILSLMAAINNLSYK